MKPQDPNYWKLLSQLFINLLIFMILCKYCQGQQGCVFHDGLTVVNEGVRFIRLREDAALGKEILTLKAYPRSKVSLQNTEKNTDHKYFSINEINATTIAIVLSRSLEDLVDRDMPKNLLKFRVLCAAKNEKLEEASYLSVTVYIEDVNDNKPEFLNTPYVVNVPENTPIGATIYEDIQAFDRDKPNTPNSEIHFSMSTVPDQLSVDGSSYFALKSPHKPLLILKKELDFDNGMNLFKLPIFAWDRGTPANQVNTTITINVIDVDDLPPKFTEGVYRTKINEFYPIKGIPIRIPLYFDPPIMAFDQDSLNASLIYDIISGNERQLFRVNSHNSIMYLQKEIDLEEESLPGNTFVLQIEARQKDNPLRKALARIEVEILDINDNLPEFEADFYNISIVENLPNSFSVLQVNAVDRDQGENADFIYNLIDDPEASGSFRIDSRTGWITVNDDRLLDREKRKAIHLQVEAIERTSSYIAEEKSQPNAVNIEITLLDTNDNTPKFEHGNLYEFKVPTTAPIDYKVGQVKALDPDEGPNGLIRYEMQRPKKSGYIPFRLDNTNGTIYVSGPLRRGRIAVFIEASDKPLNPSERRFSLAVITIKVFATIDEQTIDFVGAPYEFWVGSNAPLGSSVGQVRTTLTYDGEDEIIYDLLHTYSEGVPFAIEERSGIITVIRELSQFNRNLYQFEAVANYLFANRSTNIGITQIDTSPLTIMPQVEVTDEGVLITNVTIHVITPIDNKIHLRPIIEEINMNVIKFHVEENAAGAIIGQLLYKNGINIINHDIAKPRDLTLKTNTTTTISSRLRSRMQRQNWKKRIPRRLTGESNIKLRYIIANQQEVINKITITEDGTLLTLTGLDREQKDKYDLTVIVEYSSGQVSGAGIYQVEIIVDDVNDNAPKFHDQHYIGLIRENSPKGVQVSLNKPIIINDLDMGKNAEFKVTLQGDYNELFHIDFVSKENASTLNSHSHMHASAKLELFNIHNLTEQWNDELKFIERQYDSKSTNFRMYKYPFYKITYTGVKTLDREKDQMYNFKLLAIDTGGLKSQITLSILIADVNDNAPIFESISIFKNSRITIREYTPDMEIFFVEDPAELMPAFNTMSSIVSPPYLLPGTPRSNENLTYNSSYIVQARARSADRIKVKRSMKSTSKMVKVPKIPKCPLFAIYEDTPLYTKILQMTATDEDYGRNAQIHYEILNEQIDDKTLKSGPIFSKLNTNIKYFIIDKLSGEISVNHPLPANIEVWLNLTASDIDSLMDYTCLRFTVIDVNNYAPTFKKSWYSFEIAEGNYTESILGQVMAVDMDFNENANISYSIREQYLPFQIQQLTGIIKIVTNLDRELKDKYTFQVIASDNAEPKYRMSSSVDVEVYVLDVNDNRPQFISYDDMAKADLYISDVTDRSLQIPLFKAYLDRNTKPGTFVKQITAIDKDYIGNGNGLVLYSLLHVNHFAPVFQIDSRDGVITTVSNFHNYNDYDHLNVTIIAADLGSPSYSSTAVVLVNLQGKSNYNELDDKFDLQSNITLFQYQYYEIEIMENNEAPTELIKLNFTTSRLNVELYRWTLWLENGSNIHEDARPPFEYNQNFSIIYALEAFDREITSHYKLRLRGERTNREGRTYTRLQYPINDERLKGLENNECRIVVKILDDNDNMPKFKDGTQPIIAVIPRTATFSYPVTKVEATDADDGLNAEIRYRLLNEPTNLFGIDEYTGKIRLIANIDTSLETRVYGFDVKATDRAGADDGQSSIVNVFVYQIDEDKQVRLVLEGRPIEVERKIDALVDALSDALGMEIRVRLLEPHMDNKIEQISTDAYIYAVDFRTNALVDMHQLQDSLAQLEFDVLRSKQEQLLQQKYPDEKWYEDKIMPRIIELSEFGQIPSYKKSVHTATLWSSLQILTVIIFTSCGVGAIMLGCCFICLKQKRNFWNQQEFPPTDANLTYAKARAGFDNCRRRRHRQQQHVQQHQHQLQHQHQQQQSRQSQSIFTKTGQRQSQQSLSSLSAKTQSTALATGQKLESDWPHKQQHRHQQQQQQQQQQPKQQQPQILHATHHQHYHVQQQQTQQQQLQQLQLQQQQQQHQPQLQLVQHHTQLQPQQQQQQQQTQIVYVPQLQQHSQNHYHQHQQQQHLNNERNNNNNNSNNKNNSSSNNNNNYINHNNNQFDHRPREYIDVPLPKSVTALRSTLEQDNKISPFVLKYKTSQPVNNLSNQNYETSMFSLNSNGQDSGVDFLSSRELYETSPDSFDSQQRTASHHQYQHQHQALCPRHAKEHMKLKVHNNINNNNNNTDSSDNYEDSLQNDDTLVVTNCRSLCEHHLKNASLLLSSPSKLQSQSQLPCSQELYVNSQFEKRSCVRHSFSGFKDDLMQDSPRVSLKPRGHILRNSMNDLEERLHNLEQSFHRPIPFK